jgi:hypothetical protein
MDEKVLSLLLMDDAQLKREHPNVYADKRAREMAKPIDVITGLEQDHKACLEFIAQIENQAETMRKCGAGESITGSGWGPRVARLVISARSSTWCWASKGSQPRAAWTDDDSDMRQSAFRVDRLRTAEFEELTC